MKTLGRGSLLTLILAVQAIVTVPESYAEAFVPAKKIESPGRNAYPGSARVGGREGIVTISFDVNTDGTTSDHAIEYSTGDSAFEKALMKEYERTHFSPAKIDGEPYTSRRYERRTYYMKGKSRAVSRGLKKDWLRFWDDLEAGDEVSARKRVEHMERIAHQSLVDELYLQLAWASFYDTVDADDEAYLRLKAVFFLYSVNENLPEKIIQTPTFFAPLFKKYQYEARHGLIGAARKTVDAIVAIGGETQSSQLASQHFQSMLAKVTNREMTTDVNLKPTPFGASHHSAEIELLRRSISISKHTAGIWSITAGCGEWQRTLQKDDSAKLMLPTSEERCSLVARGEEGASFTVVQYPDADAVQALD